MSKVFIFLILTCITFDSIFAEECPQSLSETESPSYGTPQEPQQNIVKNEDFAEVTLPKKISPPFQKPSAPLPNREKSSSLFMYGSVLGILPGVGFSSRKNNVSIDTSFHSLLLLHSLSLTLSKIVHLESDEKTNFYVSFGGGFIGVVGANFGSGRSDFFGGLIFPLRAGLEATNFFGDIGVIGGITPHEPYFIPPVIPEIRFGLKF